MTTSDKMTHAQLMNVRDGAAYVWIDGERRFAKLLLDGRTLARIDRLVDGTIAVSSDGTRNVMSSWEQATAWLTARATAAMLECGTLYTVGSR